MNIREAIERVSVLPPERQAEVMDFIEFLLARESAAPHPEEHGPLRQDPFVGLWSDRPDMADGTTWTRHIRQRERAR